MRAAKVLAHRSVCADLNESPLLDSVRSTAVPNSPCAHFKWELKYQRTHVTVFDDAVLYQKGHFIINRIQLILLVQTVQRNLNLKAWNFSIYNANILINDRPPFIHTELLNIP